ncbi:MAG: phosphatase, partial [Bacteroidota bacterium]
MGPLQGLSRKHVVPRAAIIDLGTNTFHLLVIDKTPDGNWKKIKVIRKTVKLGKGGLKDGIIAPAAFERGLNVLGHFSQLIDAYSPDDVIALATSGIRSTSNGVDFIRHVKKLTGINIRAIDGVQEASFILDGVRQTLPEHLGRVLIMDIGGGSTEFIIADRSK